MKQLVADLSQRISTALLGFAFTLVIVRNVGGDLLSEYFIAFAVSAILIWLTDFGLVNIMIKFHAQNQKNLVRNCFTLKLITSTFGFILVVLIFSQTSIFQLNLLLLSAVYLDMFTDSLVPFRQIAYTWRTGFFLQVVKKVLAISILFGMSRVNDSLDYTHLFMVLSGSAAIILIFDVKRLGLDIYEIDKKFILNSFKVWFQSGGTMLSALDSIILGSVGAKDLLNVLNVSRKLLVFITIPASSTTARTLHLASSKNNDGLYSHFRDISKLLLLILAPCIVMIFYSSEILTYIFGFEPEKSSVILCCTLLSIAPLGAITASLNSYMLGRGLHKKLAITTYVSSAGYLTCLFLGHLFGSLLTWLCIGLVINTLIELVLQISFVKFKKNPRPQD